MAGNIGISARDLQSRILAGALWSTLSSVIALPLAIVVSVVLARVLGPQEFARFAYLTLLVPLLYQLLDLGFAQAVCREAARSFAAGEADRTRVLLGQGLGWNLLRLPLVAALVLWLAHPGLVVGVVVTVSLVLSMGAGGVVFGLSAENRGAASARVALFQAVVVAAVTIAAALAGGSGTTVWGLAFAAGAAAVPAWIAVSSPTLRRAGLRPRLPRRLPAGFWRFALLSLALGAAYGLVFSRSEVLVLNAFGRHEALAVFALAYGLAQRLTTPVDTILGPLDLGFSALGAAHPERLRRGVERALRLAVFGVAGVTASALVGVAFLAPVLFGDRYPGVAWAFTALAGASLLQSAAHPLAAAVYALGRQGTVLRAYGVALALDLTLAVPLVLVLGLWGAVVANVAGALCAVSLLARATRETATFRSAGVPGRRVARSVGGSCVLAAAAGALVTRIDPVLGAAAAFAVGTLVFAVTGRNLLRDDDAAVLLGALPRRVRRLSRMFVPVLRPPRESLRGASWQRMREVEIETEGWNT